ncbi:protein YhfH [Peribacillus loiseleuriae]|nr:protein YhfH [Peribacillus loiseleuriae]
MQTKKPMEFFRNLPPKQCPDCGHHIDEQAESYAVKCTECSSKK